MKLILLLKIVILSSVTVSSVAFADVVVNSPLGTRLIFSEKISGEHYDPYAWKKLFFKGNGDTIDLGIKDRYFTEDGSSKVSPSGRYLVVISISGSYLDSENGKKTYVDRAYCSVVDMKNGCYVSNWDGEVCGYNWIGNKDVLASSDDVNADSFDFNSMRPSVNDAQNSRSTSDAIENVMRCDPPNKDNIVGYQNLAKLNEESKNSVHVNVIRYLNAISTEKTITIKSYLFSSLNNNLTKAYLVPGDKVKVIQSSPDNKWVNIGYINAKGVPLVAWVMADSLAK